MTEEQVAQVTLGDLLPAGLSLVVLAVVLAVGAKVMSDVDDTFADDVAGFNESHNTNGTVSMNASIEGKHGLLEMASQIPLIATVIALSAVLFIVVRLIR